MSLNVKPFIRIAFVCAAMSIAAAAPAQIPLGGNAGEALPALTAAPLTPEMLGMPRSQIAMTDRMIRLFNGRGGVCIRDKSLTGLQTLKYPPIDLRDYRFFLQFRETNAKVLIQDVFPDLYDAKVENWKNLHPLGTNFGTGLPYVLLLQQAYWEPNAYFRTGTFHKLFGNRWISFGIATKTNVSAEKDEIYMEVEIENREAEPLDFVASPDQRSPDLTLTFPNQKTPPASPVTHPDAFTLASDQIRITVVSDLTGQEKEGWRWEIPGHSKSQAHFAIILQQASAPAPAVVAPDLAQRMERADQALRSRLEWAGEALPQINTNDPAFDGFYRRCILSVLETRWERENFTAKPFYAVGTWIFTIPWDTSFASEMLSVLDPAGLREAFLAYVRAGLMTNSWVPWNGNGNANTYFPGTKLTYWYVQSPFAEMRILQDYLNQTGDKEFLNHSEQGATIFEWMKRMGRELEKQYGRPDGLMDFGAGSQRMIEIRTDGYEHVVAASNGLAFAYYSQLAEWCRERNDPDAALFEGWAKAIQEALNQKLWDEKDGWFVNLYPDGSKQLVLSYHLFDLLDAGILSPHQREAMIGRLKEGEFLGPLGMYSMSKADRAHWDLEDVDFGGGGQYTGQPLRIVESLYRLGHPELAWDILSRCIEWTKYFPLIPQEVFADNPRSPEVEMPLELDAASAMGAIVFGVFGLRPHADGSLAVAPSYHRELGQARLTGYKFRGHSYDVVMGPWDYEVFRDGKLVKRTNYATAVEFMADGTVKD
jgi:hypothetical protein